MPEGLWIALAIVAGVIVYAVASVWRYMRQSRRDWERVDHSKLREWQDDDDW